MKKNKQQIKSMRSHTLTVSDNEQGGNNFWCVQKELLGGRCINQCIDCKWHSRYD